MDFRSYLETNNEDEMATPIISTTSSSSTSTSTSTISIGNAFCSIESIEQSEKVLNNSLSNLGFSSINLQSKQPQDISNSINLINMLVNQLQKENQIKQETLEIQRRLNSEREQLVQNQFKLQQTINSMERDNGNKESSLKTLREKTGYEREKLMQEKNDLQKKLNASLQREDQLQKELQKRDKDISKLKDRMQPVNAVEKGKVRNTPEAIAQLIQLNAAPALKPQAPTTTNDLLQTTMNAFEEKFNEILQENEVMRKLVYKVQNEVDDALTTSNAQIQQNKEQLPIELQKANEEQSESSIDDVKLPKPLNAQQMQMSLDWTAEQLEKIIFGRLAVLKQRLLVTNSTSVEESAAIKELVAIINEQDRLLRLSLEDEYLSRGEEKWDDANKQSQTQTQTQPPPSTVNRVKRSDLPLTTPARLLTPTSARFFSPSKLMDLSPAKAIDKENQAALFGDDLGNF